MSTIHCHQCGGVIHDPAVIEHRPPRFSAQLALTHPGACTCAPPVVYDDPPIIDLPPDPTPGAPP